METNKFILQYSSNLQNITESNSSFDSGKLRVAYTGKNRNNTYISKQAFEDAIPSMYNCPVVANYIRECNEIGSHDGEWVDEENGDIKYVNITQPIGVIPESATWDWETVTDDGEIHQYLCVDVLLWKRQEAYKKIKENGVTKQSMEINVFKGSMEDDFYNIENFEFEAFCLLGTAEPCFESAALFTFSKSEFKDQYSQMLAEFKEAFAEKKVKEDETENMFEKLLEKYSVAESDIKFDVEGLSDEELEAKFAEAFEAEEEVAEEVEETAETEEKDDTDEESTDDETEEETEESTDDGEFALNSNVVNELMEGVRSEKAEDEYGQYSRYCFVDYDAEKSLVYCWDSADWKLYGFTYAVDGDAVAVDFETRVRMKYDIVPFVGEADDESMEYSYIKEITENVVASVRGEYSEMETELAELKTFAEKVKCEKDAEFKAELFEKFDELLAECEEYEALKKAVTDGESKCTSEELSGKLYEMYGRREAKFCLNEKKKNKISLDVNQKDDEEPYGDIFNGIRN